MMVLFLVALGILFGFILLYQRFSREVPILMYHRVADIPGDRNTVSLEMFAQQLKYLQEQGYHAISLEDLYRYLTQKQSLPPKPVILTFDDGYENNLTNALPLLLQYGIKASVFVVAGWIGQDNGWENYPGKPNCRIMTWEQLKQWQAAGMEIGSHTMNHPALSQLTKEQIQEELINSKNILEEGLGSKINFLCYPYGDFDQRVEELAKKAGYQGALAIFQGTSLWKNDLWALRRVVISCRQPLKEFALKVSPWHMVFIAMRLLEKRINQVFKK